MNCSNCGKEVAESTAISDNGLLFCNNLCKYSFSKSSKATANIKAANLEEPKSGALKLSPGTLTSAIRGHFKTRHSTVSKIGYDSSF